MPDKQNLCVKNGHYNYTTVNTNKTENYRNHSSCRLYLHSDLFLYTTTQDQTHRHPFSDALVVFQLLHLMTKIF